MAMPKYRRTCGPTGSNPAQSIETTLQSGILLFDLSTNASLRTGDIIYLETVLQIRDAAAFLPLFPLLRAAVSRQILFCGSATTPSQTEPAHDDELRAVFEPVHSLRNRLGLDRPQDSFATES